MTMASFCCGECAGSASVLFGRPWRRAAEPQRSVVHSHEYWGYYWSPIFKWVESL
jgi:hypothetical protein